MNDFTPQGNILSTLLYLSVTNYNLLSQLNYNLLNYTNMSCPVTVANAEPAVTTPNVKQDNCCNNSNSESTSMKHKKDKIEKSVSPCGFETCSKSFEYKWQLDRHKATHLVSKQFKCSYSGCGKEYKSKENLNLHIKNKHLNIKPYECQFCKVKFSHRNGKFYIKFKYCVNLIFRFF
jgi:uncharacterized Zn-finger protein